MQHYQSLKLITISETKDILRFTVNRDLKEDHVSDG